MKKLVVCGDSFMSSISYDSKDLDNGAGCHFTELLAKRLNCEHISLARGGCSNQTIRLQIEESLKINPDYLIIGLTSVDRFEFPIEIIESIEYFNKCHPDDNSKLYDPNDLLGNIKYNGFPDKSGKNDIFKNIEPKLISETLSNIFNFTQTQHQFTKSEVAILMDWFNRFYDPKWKSQQDSWIIWGGLKKLKERNINFYCINTTLFPHEFYEFKERMIEYNSELTPHFYVDNVNIKYRFHTTIKSQEILSDLWYDKLIRETNLI